MKEDDRPPVGAETGAVQGPTAEASARRERAMRRHLRSASDLVRPHLSLLPLIGIIVPFLLATYALTQPWAKARVFGVWGISRSPEAILLVLITLAGMIAATIAAAMRGQRLGIAAKVHFVTGLCMCGVAYSAYRLVLGAGTKVLGIPLASVRPGAGLKLFALAALMVLVLGAVEWFVAGKRRRERERAPAG